MSIRAFPAFAALIAALALTAGPAAAQSPTDHPAPGAVPGACKDQSRPSSGFTRKAARRARSKHVLRGVARDVGCGVDRVMISVAHKQGRRCRNLTTMRRLSRPTKCSRHRWLPVKGATKWSFRFPRRLAKGTYLVRTRAVDFAGNVQHPRAKRLRLR
jgi:hypothetical protein